MKYWLWILTLVIALSGCAEKGADYCLRLVEFASKEPIVTASVVLVPRVILLETAPGTPNPNLDYALQFITDDQGIFCLNEETLKKLFSHFEGQSGHIDCTVEGFSRFTIEYNPTSKKYLLTAFDKNNQVRPLDDQFLIRGETVELPLDRLSVPSANEASRRLDEAENMVVENVQRIAADIEYLLKSQDGYILHSDISAQDISNEIASMVQGERGELRYKECDYDDISGLRKCYASNTHKELGAYWLHYKTTIDFTCCELFGFTETRSQLVTFDIVIKEEGVIIFYPAALIDLNEPKTGDTHRDSCSNFPCKPQHYIE
jgi:hypothetical protein